MNQTVTQKEIEEAWEREMPKAMRRLEIIRGDMTGLVLRDMNSLQGDAEYYNEDRNLVNEHVMPDIYSKWDDMKEQLSNDMWRAFNKAKRLFTPQQQQYTIDYILKFIDTYQNAEYISWSWSMMHSKKISKNSREPKSNNNMQISFIGVFVICKLGCTDC